MTAPRWVMFSNFSDALVGELRELVTQAALDGYLTGKDLPNRTDMINALARAREAYWADQQRDKAKALPAGTTARRAGRRGTALKADLCTITAAEANAWLQSLPQLPWGDL